MCLMCNLIAFASLALVVPAAYPDAFAAKGAVTAPASDRISVSVVGKGPDVILIPGLASSAHVWDRTVEHLKATHRVHVVQVSGFAGAAPGANASGPVVAPVLEALHSYIASNKLQGAAVIGHSLGGLMAMELAIRHPGDAGRIMIVDSLPFFGMVMTGPKATVADTEPVARQMRDRLMAASQEAFAAAEPKMMASLVGSKGPEAQAAIAAASASDRRVVAQAMYDDFTTDLRPDLARISVPVTMLYPYSAATGASQAMFDSLYTGAFAAVKQARLKRIDDSLHFIQIDQPEAFLKEVDTFLQ